MIIHDLNIGRPRRAFWPFEAYPPLTVDPYAELPLPVAVKGFQPVAWQAPQVFEAGRRIEYRKPLPALPFESGKGPDAGAMRERFRLPVPVAFDHAAAYSMTLRDT
jgi:hypothetical protein